jgi:hypothetical protein
MAEPEIVEVCLLRTGSFSVEKRTNALWSRKVVAKLPVAYRDSPATLALLTFVLL